MPRPKTARAFIEVWCDEHGPRDDSNIGFQSVLTLAQQPGLRKSVVSKQQLRTALRNLKKMGFDVAE